MKIYTAPGETYIVTSSSGCDVTTDTGVLIKTCAAGQDYFTAMTDATMLSDDAATVTVATGEVLAMLGGGSGGGEGESYVLTAEEVQKVVPINWERNLVFGRNTPSNFTSGIEIGYGASSTNNGGTSIGDRAKGGYNGIAIGHVANAGGYAVACGTFANAAGEAVAIGRDSKAIGDYSIAVGRYAESKVTTVITLGVQFTEKVDGTNVTRTCITEGTGSITIGAGANTLNTIAEDGVITESANAVTIGCKAANSAPDSVVIGAQAKAIGLGGGVGVGASSNVNYLGVAIGSAAFASSGAIGIGYKAKAEPNSVAIGFQATTHAYGGCVVIGSDGAVGPNATAVGVNSEATVNGSSAFGKTTKATAAYCTAIGTNAVAADWGVVVHRSTAEDGTITQLYFSGANTPLATTYEGGEAMMGYVVRQKDADGNYQTIAAGTNKLSALFPNNSNFAPTTTGLDDEEGTTPMIFHPSDLDLPQEEEEPAEPETEYTPLPVYPIVEPEIDDTNQ